MADQERVILDTKIEREVHRLIKTISEGTYDKLQMYARRNELPIEPEVLTHLLKTMQVVITEYEMKHMDGFHAAVKKELDAYVGEENPTETVSAKPTKSETPTSETSSTSKKRKSVTLSI